MRRSREARQRRASMLVLLISTHYLQMYYAVATNLHNFIITVHCDYFPINCHLIVALNLSTSTKYTGMIGETTLDKLPKEIPDILV